MTTRLTRHAGRITAFAAAALLFQVQLWSVEGWLPALGGAPAVWITALAAFQLLLLAGYATAHAVRRSPPRWGYPLFFAAWLLALVLLWWPHPPALLDSQAPVRSIWQVLLRELGLPFAMLAATAPLLQHWLAHRAPRDDSAYRLAGSSNLGSMLGLLTYPLLFSPWLTLFEQAALWRVLVSAVGLLGMPLCAWLYLRAGTPPPPVARQPSPPWRDQALWVGLAALPAGLLASTTLRITTDVSPFDWLWVLPLALYLWSWILAYTRPRPTWRGRLGLLGIICLLSSLHHFFEPVLLTAQLAGLFLLSWVIHAEVVARKPAVGDLTRFHLLTAVGGAAGGLATTLLLIHVLPFAWDQALWVGFAVFALWRLTKWDADRYRLTFRPGLWQPSLLLGIMAAIRAWQLWGANPGDQDLFAGLSLLLGVAGCVLLLYYRHRWAWCVAAVWIIGWIPASSPGVELVAWGRNFYGTRHITEHRVETPLGLEREQRFVHGTTIHNGSRLVPLYGFDADGNPDLYAHTLLYYTSDDPIGTAWRALPPPGERRVAVLGLGAGHLACFRNPGENWVLYEIDPLVLSWARTKLAPLRYCDGLEIPVVLGDGRIALQRRDPDAEGRFDALVMDAFTSDAVPTHLVTVEALRLYVRQLEPDGLLIVNTSNRILCLQGVVAAAAEEAGLAYRTQDGRTSSWAVLARTETRVAEALPAGGPAPRMGPLWTDDHRPVLPALSPC